MRWFVPELSVVGDMDHASIAGKARVFQPSNHNSFL